MKNPQLAWLKVKIKTLAAEAKIIRQDELKWADSMHPKIASEDEDQYLNALDYLEGSSIDPDMRDPFEVAKSRSVIKLAKAKARARQKKANDPWQNHTRNSLYRHRMDVVRPESRATNIAMGFLNDRQYEDIERSYHIERFGAEGKDLLQNFNDMWDRVAEIAFKYNTNEKYDSFASIKKAIAFWVNQHPQADQYYLKQLIARFE